MNPTWPTCDERYADAMALYELTELCASRALRCPTGVRDRVRGGVFAGRLLVHRLALRHAYYQPATGHRVSLPYA